MMKKAYRKPEVVTHQPIVFETGVSNCLYVFPSPNGNVCARHDNTWGYVKD